MKCNNCGSDIRDNTSFCTKCGARTTGVTLPELESGSQNNQIQTYTPPAPAAPAQTKAPEKKKKSIKKPILIIIAALVVLALGLASFFVIRRNTRSGMPGIFGSVSGSDTESEADIPGIIDPSTPSSSEKELAIKYVRAVESGKIEDVAALYCSDYCQARGYSANVEFVKYIDFFFKAHAGDSLSDFVVLKSENVEDKEYTDSLGIPFKKLRRMTMGLNSADNEQIFFLYEVKTSDGWFVLYPSRFDFKAEE